MENHRHSPMFRQQSSSGFAFRTDKYSRQIEAVTEVWYSEQVDEAEEY